MKESCFLVIILVLTFFSGQTFAQNISNEGTDFWSVFPTHIPSGNNLGQLAVFVTSKENSEVTVSCGSFSQTKTIPANTAVQFDVPRANAYVNQAEANQNLINRGIHIKVTNGQPKVSAYTHIYGSARSAASLILPFETLGQTYYSMNYIQSAGGSNYLTLVCVEPNTKLNLHEKNGNVINITLNNIGDVYEYLPSGTPDITGVYVETDLATSSCKRFAVFSGSSVLNIGCSTSQDPIYQQLYPTVSWGKTYGAVPFFNRRFILRIMAQEDNTSVTYNASTYVINKGQFIESPQLTASTYITADKLVSVAQYSLTQACSAAGGGSAIGDPEMVILNPIEFNINKVTVFSSNLQNITEKYINVLIKTTKTSTFTINGVAPIINWSPLAGNPLFSYAQIKVTASSLTLTADDGFNAIAYGYGSVESYGYSAGTNLSSNNYLTVVNDSKNEESPNGCIGVKMDFKVNLNYQPDKIVWTLDSGTPEVVMNPIPEVRVINGQSIYVYRYGVGKVYTTKGGYNLKVDAHVPTNASNCISGDLTTNYIFNIYNLPTAKFDAPDSTCQKMEINFVDQSMTNEPNASITNWLWDFKDGTTSTDQNPKHQFAKPGYYNVSLISKSNLGCYSDAVSKIIKINPVPVSNFTNVAKTCIKTDVLFTDKSTIDTTAISKAKITNWHWDFGDGNTDDRTDTLSFKHQYTSAGNYIIKLATTSDKGCVSAVFTKNIEVTDLPQANFTIPYVCLTDGIATFTNTSINADGSDLGLTYLWSFGDTEPAGMESNNSTSKNGVHIYTKALDYTVTLTITNANNCVSVKTQTFNIYNLPTAKFDVPDSTCQKMEINFVDQSITNEPNASIANWLWDFKDGTTSTDQNPKHQFAEPGYYNVSLISKSNLGCYSDAVSKIITINPVPISNFTNVAKTCIKTDVLFTDKSTVDTTAISKAKITNWHWDFGDGNTDDRTDTLSFKHQYTSAGTYTIKLTTTSDKGCLSAVFTKNIEVTDLPQASFTMPDICLTDGIATFTNTSINADGSDLGLTYLWGFGDTEPAGMASNTSTSKNGVHIYTKSLDYTVTLTITNANNCVSVKTKTFTVNGSNPKADFNFSLSNTNCGNTPIIIENTSTIDFGKVTKIEVYKDFDKNPTNIETFMAPVPQEIILNYDLFGTPATKTYNIRLKAYSGMVCSDFISKTVVVKASPILIFNNMPPACENDGQVIVNQASETSGIPGSGIYSSDGNGISPSGTFTPKIAGLGTHNITYTYTADNGCSASITQTILVNESPTADAGATLYILAGGQITIPTIANGKNLVYSWTPALGLNNPNILNPIASPEKDTEYTLLVRSDEECTAVSMVTVKVLQALSPPNTFTPNGDGVNDVWNIKYLETYPNATVEVFNRNGARVFFSNGYTVPFDGNYMNEPLPVGVYYYLINPRNGRKNISGPLTIIR